MELCLPNNHRINNKFISHNHTVNRVHAIIQTYSVYNHTIHTINIIHTNTNHTIYCNRSPSSILTTHSSNLKRLKKLLSRGVRFGMLNYILLYLRDTNIIHQKTRIQTKVREATRTRNSLSLKNTYYCALQKSQAH